MIFDTEGGGRRDGEEEMEEGEAIFNMSSNRSGAG